VNLDADTLFRLLADTTRLRVVMLLRLSSKQGDTP
jgi:hypothetical protein